MRKCICFIFFSFAGTGIYLWLQKVTKNKQKIARANNKHVPYGPYEACLKRPLDALVAGSALIVLSPIVGVTGLIVKKKLGSPILFTQERPGLNQKIFKIYKYRTMTDKKDAYGNLLPDKIRLTSFGKKLRATSLDELPELINIIKGDMSIVGPRPLLVEYLERYNDEQKHRHDVRPGLTGYAQVSGRNDLSWEEKFEDDLIYIKKITFLGDLKIILKTIKIVFNQSGINSKNNATMPTFLGN